MLSATLVKHKGPVFADRSFNLLLDVVKIKIKEGPIAPICTGLLGLAVYYSFVFVHLCKMMSVESKSKNS